MISVCIATYNGEKYIREQIESILKNITSSDEVIVSDDGSTDKTLKILEEYCLKNNNIKILNGPKLGVVRNFENAIENASGDIIFLSDQDDIWMENKVSFIKEVFEKSDCWLVVHDATLIDKRGKEIDTSFFSLRNSGSGLVKNFYKNSYIGCCMAFKKELVGLVCPFPEKIPMHDWWIGIVSDLYSKTVFVNNKLIGYRRHGSNVTGLKHLSLKKMLKNRALLFFALIRYVLKIR
ncbi:MAG: glycosyltransferase family 2 protein [Phascolarctobacterium sp.]|nr:glycosyltransferase family 2 protein [Phascolarctobacterium sp.]